MISLLLLLVAQTAIPVSETELIKFDRRDIEPGSIEFSPDRMRVAYTSADSKSVFVDGKKYGPFASAGKVSFSGDSKDWGCAITDERDRDQTARKGRLLKNGRVADLTDSVIRVFRAGSRGPLAWIEQSTNGLRVVLPTAASKWCERIDKMDFDALGESYVLTCRQRVVEMREQDDGTKKQVVTGNKDFFLVNGEERIEREGRNALYLAPKSLTQMSIYDEGEQSSRLRQRVLFGTRQARMPGEIKTPPVFSESGRSYALRGEFTGVGPNGNRPQSAYMVNNVVHREFMLQSGLVFYPGKEKYAFCGFEEKEPYFYISDRGPVKYADFGQGFAFPSEAYRRALVTNDKLVLFFQSKRTRPTVFVEGVGGWQLPVNTVFEESLCISTDGKWLAFGAETDQLNNCYVLNLDKPDDVRLVGKMDYQMDDPNTNRPFWLESNKLRFLALRKGKVLRMEAEVR
jgi:hypothetical protein